MRTSPVLSAAVSLAVVAARRPLVAPVAQVGLLDYVDRAVAAEVEAEHPA
jgi:hypothetical protein